MEESDWKNKIGNSLIKECFMTIGGQEVSNHKFCDKCKTLHEWQYGRQSHTCEWYQIWKQLTNKKEI